MLPRHSEAYDLASTASHANEQIHARPYVDRLINVHEFAPLSEINALTGATYSDARVRTVWA